MAAVLKWLPEPVSAQKDVKVLHDVRAALEADWTAKKEGDTIEALESSLGYLSSVNRCCGQSDIAAFSHVILAFECLSSSHKSIYENHVFVQAQQKQSCMVQEWYPITAVQLTAAVEAPAVEEHSMHAHP